MKQILLFLMIQISLLADFTIKDIYSVNHDIVVEIIDVDGKINEDVKQDVCKVLQKNKIMTGMVYIKYRYSKTKNNKWDFIESIDASKCIK